MIMSLLGMVIGACGVFFYSAVMISYTLRRGMVDRPLPRSAVMAVQRA